jgi:threonine dehydrogenase-like Zn-dependent dehydrogenase
MNAWVLTGPSTFELKTIDREMKPEEVKIKIKKAAITGSDIYLYNGKGGSYPIIPIRLAVGLISETNNNNSFKMGERVVISPYINSKDENEDNIKVLGYDVDGLLSDYAIVPVDNVHLLPEGVSDGDAIFTEYIALAMNVISRLHINKMKYVVILGSNAFGIIMAQLCIYYQAIPIVIDNNAEKLALASKSGIYYTINSNKEDVLQSVTSITGGNMADYTIYECREGRAFNNIYNFTKNGGYIGIVSTNDMISSKFNIDLKLIFKKQLTLVGINNGSKEISSAINIIANKVLVLDKLIDLEGDYENVPELFKLSSDLTESVVKSVVNYK